MKLLAYFTVSMIYFSVSVLHGYSQNLTYSGSMHYASGSYFFTDQTHSFYLTNSLGLSGEGGSISLSLPFITQNTPWITYSPAGRLPTGGPQHGALNDSTGHRPRGGQGGQNHKGNLSGGTDQIALPDTAGYSNSGVGDPVLYGSYTVYRSESGKMLIQANSNIKIPFSEPEAGFGTGEWDMGLGVSSSIRVGSLFLYLSGMKWWLGDLPELEMNNPLTYSIGLSCRQGNGSWILNTLFSGSTEIINEYDPLANFGVGAGYSISERALLSGTFTVGLTESCSDWSVGLGWSLTL